MNACSPGHDSRPMNKIWGDEKALLLLSWMRKDDSIFIFVSLGLVSL